MLIAIMFLAVYVITKVSHAIAAAARRLAGENSKPLKLKIHERLYVEKLKQEREALKLGHPVAITKFMRTNGAEGDIHTLTSSLLKNEFGYSFVELVLNKKTGRFEPEIDADDCFSVHTYKRSGLPFARLGIMIHGFRVLDSPADTKEVRTEHEEAADAELLN